MLLSLESLRRDGGTQPRATINLDTAYEYGEEMKAGAKFPAVVAFYDGSEYWLADGFHRVEGAFSAGLDQIECDVRQGTLEDAQWYSFGVNKSHGLRRTNEDKQRAVKAALTHPKSGGMSDNKIASHCGVSNRMVAEYRSTMKLSESAVRIGSDGRSINTANIGKRPTANYEGGTRVTVELTPRAASPDAPPEPIHRNTGAVQSDSRAEQDSTTARDMESIAAAVWKILDSESTPAEIAAYIIDSKIDVSSWEDARDFLTEAIEKAKRG